MTIRDTLEAARRELIEKLRHADPLTTAELERVDRAIAAMDPRAAMEVTENEFAGLTIIEACKVYLARSRRRIHRKDLTKALIDGGIGSKGARPAEWKVNQSLSWHQTNGSITIEDDLVGLPEWADAPKSQSGL